MAKRHLEQATLAGAWMTVVPNILNDMNFSSDKFWDNVCLCF